MRQCGPTLLASRPAIDGRRSDVHYQDLDVIDREIAAAGEGRFTIQPLRFHLAGLPSYLVLALKARRRSS